jgi:hypothetical protein
VSSRMAPQEVHHHDVVNFALEELRRRMHAPGNRDVIVRLRDHLAHTTP